MSGRKGKKSQFSNLIFKLNFKLLMCPLDTKDQNVAGFHPSEPLPGYRHELIAKLTAPRDH